MLSAQLSTSQVNFYMEAITNCLSTEFCVPAWSTRTVSRADQAYFDNMTRSVKIVIFKTGTSNLDFDVALLGHPLSGVKDSYTCNNEIMKKIQDQKTPHIVLEVAVQCLVPVSDLKEKLEKDIADQKKTLEKQLKSTITTAVKSKAKAAKKRKVADDDDTSSTATKQTKFIFDTLGLSIPKDKDEQIQILTGLIEQESTYDTLVKQAVESIKMPSKIPLTRMIGEDDKAKQNRAKLLQAALAQAQAQSDEASTSTSNSQSNLFGFQAALTHAEETGEVIVTIKDCCSVSLHLGKFGANVDLEATTTTSNHQD